MKTRRSAAVANPEPEVNGEESFGELELPEDLDVELLANLLGPDVSVSAPTKDSILDIYRLILEQAEDVEQTRRELDAQRGELDIKEVELEQAHRDSEAHAKDHQTALEKAEKEATEAKTEQDKLALTCAELKAKVVSLSEATSASSGELDALKHRVDDTEREKRDLVGVISRLKQEGVQREEEIQTLRGNLKEARQDHQSLESTLRELRSTETATKYKLDSLTQQFQLAQTQTERTTAELNEKSEEFVKYRRAKHAELAKLQSDLDAVTQSHASLTTSHKTLQSSHTSQSHQLSQSQARVQDLTGQLAEQELTYASEVSGLKRLVTMIEEREKQTKEMVDGIERDWANVGESSKRVEDDLRAELAEEKESLRIALDRADTAEAVLRQLNSGELPLPSDGPSTPSRYAGTPIRHGLFEREVAGLSPTVAMVSQAQKSGKTFTEIYGEYIKLQEAYSIKNAENIQMDATLSSVLAQIEERAPILAQQRAEYERLQSEAAQLASQLSQALTDRDHQSSIAQESAQKLQNSVKENNLLSKQLTDLGRQIQVLLKEIARRDDPSLPSDEDIDMMAPMSEPAETIDAVITNNLVLYRSIVPLQEQNQRLLKITREMGGKMEAEEKEYKDSLEQEQGEAVREAHEMIQDLAGQLELQKKTSESTIQAYVKERDMLRSMLTRAERAVAAGGATTNGVSAITASSSELERDLAETQNQFETYKSEMGIDSVKLREDLVAAQKEAGQRGAELAKAHAKIEYMNDRSRMQNEQLEIQIKEVESLEKRQRQLYDQNTRADIQCNRLTEDILAANANVERLRNECANLRAEKGIWESVQSRLTEENRTLSVERSQLSDLMGNVQKMHNDLERAGENDRRRLESQLQMMEGQNQDLRTQLSTERDTVRHISLQKEIELKELHGRMDRVNAEHSQSREALIAAQTSSKHLQDRVDDLSRQLQGNDEKLAVYERRPSAGGVAASSEDDQDLQGEVAELRRRLRITEVDLEAAKKHTRQFQEISEANEAALATLNSTHDEYVTKTDAQLRTHESNYEALEAKFKALQVELAAAVQKQNEAATLLETERAAWSNDRNFLETQIVSMGHSDVESEGDKSAREATMRQLEERAKFAEQRHSAAIQGQAAALKDVDTLREHVNTLTVTSSERLTATQTAEAKLIASEVSWRQQRETLDKEMGDLQTRYKDLTAQNKILHQHLESVTSAATQIRKVQGSTAEDGNGEEGDDSEATKLAELRSVVAFLRKEKEIIDLQFDLKKTEASRLRNQVEHLTSQLNEARATLSEERDRAVDAASSESTHADLVDKIQQINLLRESNSTLRADADRYARNATELQAKLSTLSTELEPTKEEVRVIKAELEARNAEMKRMENESSKWQQRNAQLLTKYDRIDPAEVQLLRDEITQLHSQKATLETEKAAAEQRETDLREANQAGLVKLKEKFKHNETILKNRAEQAQNALKELAAKSEAALAEAKASIEDLTQKLQSVEASKTILEGQLQAALEANPEAAPAVDNSSELAALVVERDQLLAEKATWQASTADSSVTPTDETKAAWEAEKLELVKARDEAANQAKSTLNRATTAEKLAKGLEVKNAASEAKIVELSVAGATAQPAGKTLEEYEAGIQAAVQAAVDKVKAEAVSAPASSSEDVTKVKEEAVAAAVAEVKVEIETLKAQTQELTSKNTLLSRQLQNAHAKVKTLQTQQQDAAKADAGKAPTASGSTTTAPPPASISAAPRKASVAPNAATAAAAASAASVSTDAASKNPTGAAARATTLRNGGSLGGPGRGGAAGRGRGGAPARGGPQGLSIQGAAKRPRDSDGGAPADAGGLAKRMKPDGPAGSKPPVPIRRPPPPS